MPATHVALLRGVNLGGRNKVPMKELAPMFTAAGCRDVSTYIQSGNIIFTADPDVVDSLPCVMSAAIAQRWGHTIPVVLRTTEEIGEVLRRNPFLDEGAPADELHVMFLAERPDEARAAALDPDRSPPDTFALRGREVYLHFPGGVARSKLTTDYFDRTLGTVGTVRNWRTVTKLLELMSG